ncbi:hypothetical protein HK100_010407 [Physocladia obscura]|uniref:N-acetyltransferase domain-containing protein n=1 Tax=Physocladia obscura TaxID=109957 RepID=A0AAD5T8I8_9FUNG|nr:hypothetical protein HK100_010407 [Physocladia obscura]
MWIEVPTQPTIAITKWVPSMAPFLLKHLNGDAGSAVTRFLRNKIPQPYEQKDADDFIAHCSEEKLFTSYAIVLLNTSDSNSNGDNNSQNILAAIGSIGLVFNDPTDIEAHVAELGYWLAQEYWGRGIMSAVVGAFIKNFAAPLSISHHRADVPLRKIYAYAAIENKGSCKVLELNGFVQEGLLKQYAWKRGEYHDCAVYAFFFKPVLK